MYLLQQTLLPHAANNRPIISLEKPLTMDVVILESSSINLSICEVQLPLPVLGVSLEITFVFEPLLVEGVEVCIVEASLDCYWIIVVHCSQAVKLVVFPLPLIGHLGVGVVKSPVSLHFVVFPFPFVPAAFFVHELSLPVAHAVFLEALVPCADVELLNDVAVFFNWVFALFLDFLKFVDRLDHFASH